ncbi:MAG: gamma-glutamylcyclotransferase family protein [Rhodospirillales bacterium]|jgi:hypothetical protein|nr:hypothetical protein [Rhodospirillaceae bacterium]MDP6645519.1 gamma-glutamylcyclotransferase family protein [Rhodospirillales bacterium]MDP6843013.1 gamma-glutamylcyclotransferase family protein [Rhodospirillales bacterium]|tara:strand:+ start:2003 stop:2521 length:519 start_codon:yes stop_codon:yes gene_type:complete
MLVRPARPALSAPLYYFAYGSNMDPAQIRRRCPSARFVDIAYLADHRLAFTRRSGRRRSGVADVERCAGETVWGIVYRLLSVRDIEVLDAAEGFEPGRRRAQRYVRETRIVGLGRARPTTARPVAVNIYIARRQKNPPPPTAAYIAQLARGAAHWGLPEDYRAMLAAIGRRG